MIQNLPTIFIHATLFPQRFHWGRLRLGSREISFKKSGDDNGARHEVLGTPIVFGSKLVSGFWSLESLTRQILKEMDPVTH